VARERLLDAAGAVVARRGDLELTIAEVAAEAGCARGTVYRYAGDREGLRRAFVEREAAKVGGRVARRTGGVDDPRERLVESVLAAVDEVRRDPVLAAWFRGGAAGTAGSVALGVDALGELVVGFLTDLVGRDRPRGAHRVDVEIAADAVVRLTLSLLAHPAAGGPTSERRLVEAVLVPVVFPG
jgi:AcrR family transcriptional regulator